MIIVSGTLTVDPANHDRAADLMTTLAEATNQEEGCVQYAFWADLNVAGNFRVFEEWKDQAAIDAHMATPHMAEFLGAVGGLITGGTGIMRYDVSEATKLM